MAHFFMSVGGSKFHERLAHFFIDIYTSLGLHERYFKFWDIVSCPDPQFKPRGGFTLTHRSAVHPKKDFRQPNRLPEVQKFFILFHCPLDGEQFNPDGAVLCYD